MTLPIPSKNLNKTTFTAISGYTIFSIHTRTDSHKLFIYHLLHHPRTLRVPEPDRYDRVRETYDVLLVRPRALLQAWVGHDEVLYVVEADELADDVLAAHEFDVYDFVYVGGEIVDELFFVVGVAVHGGGF